MKALTDFVRAVGCVLLLLGGPDAAFGQASGAASAADPLGRARQLYNSGQYDDAIAAAQEATARPGTQSEANLLLGRALLERHRASRTAEDLSAARDALRAVDAGKLSDRGRLDLVVGLGEALYLDGQYRSAAGLLEPALEQMGLLPAAAREQVVDWWATAMDRYAQTRPPEERTEVYTALSDRMRVHLGRYADSSAASYWLPAAALARGDLDLAWDLALAGWVRSILSPDKGATLRADLDRLVTQALIPERVKRLPDEPDAADAASRFAAEWDEAKSRWKK
jgi:tetratricopeptide (TPR) repeat protein